MKGELLRLSYIRMGVKPGNIYNVNRFNDLSHLSNHFDFYSGEIIESNLEERGKIPIVEINERLSQEYYNLRTSINQKREVRHYLFDVLL
jgi:hypothetical protein